ncbi:hypothetical protein AB0B01_15740 [Streptomyces sp. NPDC044571]|uniref:hypothetical protein n=1 Tax=Streptomyces sp. NPDC044571 TaxID=3155371 RepID=UPI0034098DC6
MHGPGIPPQQGPQPSTGGVVALRVLFALLPVLSCGFLAWGTMLRLAVVTRKSRDWGLLAASGVLTVFWIALINADKTPDTSGWQSDTGALGTILTGFAVCVYFLIADIRHHDVAAAARTAPWYPPRPAPYVPPQQQNTTPAAYAYPPTPQQQAPAPAPAAPATPPRIGQVRAELDELSELLRKQTPPRNPDPSQPRNEGEGTAR